MNHIELGFERLQWRKARPQLHLRALAHQAFGLIPVPMNWTTNRFGGVVVAGGAPHTAADSSHGSAIATPAPRLKSGDALVLGSTGERGAGIDGFSVAVGFNGRIGRQVQLACGLFAPWHATQ